MRIGVIHTTGSPCQCATAITMALKAIGHEPVVVNSEDIKLRASELSSRCDLIIDHTDTFHGLGAFRFLVRHMLESRGARIVGSDAKACFLADDKASAKIRLAEAGIPVPPGIVVTKNDWAIPPWLCFPVITKPACEHMSRGIVVAHAEAEARDAVMNLLNRYGQPVLVERYIPGRELAVCLIQEPAGLRMLPPLEWCTHHESWMILSETFKLKDHPEEREDAKPADLPTDVIRELETLSARAFHALGLRDYARLDVRLSPSGGFFFLEANTTPSMEPQEAFSLCARWAGLEYPDMLNIILSAAHERYGKRNNNDSRTVRIDLSMGEIELSIPGGIHHPPPSTIDLARLIDVKIGESVLELGCGAGLLTIAAAKSGAHPVVATDINPRALDATLHNARKNNVENRLSLHAGFWYDALPPGEPQRFHVIIATPPQTPGHCAFGPSYGGYDGTMHLFAIIDSAPRYLEPRRGRLWILAISLANPSALMHRLGNRFFDVRLIHTSERYFCASEYESMEKGLVDHFLALRSLGCAEFNDTGNDRYVFYNLFIRASGAKRA